MYYISTAAGRVVYRGHGYAYAYGGVSYANASYDASHASTYVGSRLVFCGKIVRASSVAAYKAAVGWRKRKVSKRGAKRQSERETAFEWFSNAVFTRNQNRRKLVEKFFQRSVFENISFCGLYLYAYL